MKARRRQRNDRVAQFHAMVKRAYETAKDKGQIAKTDVSIYDKLVTCPAVVSPGAYQGGWAPPVHAHVMWERRARRMYARQSGRPLAGFFADIDWQAVYDWVLENIVPILKMLMMIVPFII